MKPSPKIAAHELMVDDYLDSIKHAERRQDAQVLLAIMQAALPVKPKMWGTGIVGFGTHHYIHDSGREGDTVAVGFSARSKALAVYGLHTPQNAELLSRLAISDDAKGCIYLKAVSSLDATVLKQAVANAYNSRNNK